MNINSLKVSELITGKLDSSACDGLTHVKQLPCFSVVESLEGYYTVSIGEPPEYSTAGSGFFIAPPQKTQVITHHTDANTGRMRARWIFFNVTVNNCYPLELLYSLPVTLSASAAAELHLLMEEIFAGQNSLKNYCMVAEIIQIITSSGEEMAVKHTEMLPVLEYLHENYTMPLTVKALSSGFHMSESSLFAKFKKAFGVSPMAYLNNLRLSQAAFMLEDSALTVSEIARQVGFADPLYFSRIFRKKYRISPKNYSKRLILHG